MGRNWTTTSHQNGFINFFLHIAHHFSIQFGRYYGARLLWQDSKLSRSPFSRRATCTWLITVARRSLPVIDPAKFRPLVGPRLLRRALPKGEPAEENLSACEKSPKIDAHQVKI